MKEKIVEILKAELFPIQLVDDSDPIEIMGVDKAADKIEQLYAKQPAVSEGEIEKVLYKFRARGIESDGSTSVGFIPPTKHKELAKAIKELLNR